MSLQHIAGAEYSLAKVEETETANGKKGKNFVYEGPYSALKANRSYIASLIPEGYYFEGLKISSDGSGRGTLTASFVESGNSDAQTATAERTTFSVEMQEVQKDLIAHPHLDRSGAEYARLWIASGCIARGSDLDEFFYKDADGEEQEISYQPTIDFCIAYQKGIKTYQEFYPVVTKISYWKRLPGASTDGKNTTGGTAKFSTAGVFEDPPLMPDGYGAGHWFKGGPKWVQQADTTWRCEEQWFYTPDGTDSDVAWIYDEEEEE